MTRREMVALLGAAAAQRALGQSTLKFRGLDHIEFTVADVEKSTAFYAQLFGGADVMKNRTTTRRYIKLGASYMAIDRADAPRIDHVCLGIEDFDIAALHANLTAQGIAYRDYPSGRDLSVADPDGTRIQLAAADGWPSLAAQTASPEPRSSLAIFQPVNLFRVEINVRNLATAFAHYGKMLGLSPGRGYAVGRGHVDLFTDTPGYRGFTVQTRPFEVTRVRQQIEDLGAHLEAGGARNAVQFRDPDGFKVEVAYSVEPAEVMV